HGESGVGDAVASTWHWTPLSCTQLEEGPRVQCGSSRKGMHLKNSTAIIPRSRRAAIRCRNVSTSPCGSSARAWWTQSKTRIWTTANPHNTRLSLTCGGLVGYGQVVETILIPDSFM